MKGDSQPITLAIGTRVRKSPFFEATRQAGCTCYTIYNHTYMPVYYKDPVADYWHLVNDVTLWDVACERQVEITGPDASPLQIQGPKAVDVAVNVFGDWVKQLKYYWFKEGVLDGIPYLLSRTGWSNEKGFEVFLEDGQYGHELWDRIMSAGAAVGIQPGAPSQIKRMEAGLLSYFNDMDSNTNPFEVGLGKYVDLEQEVDFVGKAALQRIMKEGVCRRLMGAIVDGDPIEVNGERWIVKHGNEVVGEVTSAVHSPRLKQNLVYVMLPIDLASAGTMISIVLPGDDMRSATVTALPFVSNRAN